MSKLFLKYFVFYLFIPIIKSQALDVSQTVLEQATYYETDSSIIYGSFIDFSTLKFYEIDMEKIHHTIEEPNFEFYYTNEEGVNKLSIKCKDVNRIKCNTIILGEHKSITFDYDYSIARTGGVVSFFLILYGVFSLFKGYIYFNLTAFFYSAFSLILLCREFCEFMEIKKFLNADDPKSKTFMTTFYIISIVSSFAYGFASFMSKYLKYISFGFINGLILSKLIIFFIIQSPSLKENIELKYLIAESVCCFVIIIFWLIFKDKVPNLTMVNISFIASYGIIYGINILIGGLPFIPFMILAKYYKAEEEKDKLFDSLVDHSSLYIYLAICVGLTAIGIYFNINNYKILIEKAKKKLSVY